MKLPVITYSPQIKTENAYERRHGRAVTDLVPTTFMHTERLHSTLCESSHDGALLACYTYFALCFLDQAVFAFPKFHELYTIMPLQKEQPNCAVGTS